MTHVTVVAMNSAHPTPAWVPDTGTQLRKAGVYFDAIRVAGRRGQRAAQQVAAVEDFRPGPIVRQLSGAAWLYFLVAPGTVRAYVWPPEAQRYSAMTRSAVAYVGVPAVDGDTWPLAWYSLPTPSRPYVDTALLHKVLTARGWGP